MSFVGGGLGVRSSAFYMAWPAEDFYAVLNIYYYLVQTQFKSSMPQSHAVWRSLWGIGGLQVHVSITARCDELSSWRSRPSLVPEVEVVFPSFALKPAFAPNAESIVKCT